MKYLPGVVVMAAGEATVALLFHWIKGAFGPEQVGASRRGAVIRGMLERATVLLGLLAGFPQILTAFGALKISTRLVDERSDHMSNTYFLVGNLVSLAVRNGLRGCHQCAVPIEAVREGRHADRGDGNRLA